MIRLAGVLASLLLASSAMAEGMCVDASGPKAKVAEHGGKWLILTNDQRLFLAGIYAMNPQTPPGLPYGESAALAQFDSGNSYIFFLDGDKACTPMPVPKELIDMVMEIGQGVIKHEANGT